MHVTRFAPSPTGNLHVGNIRTALHNYLLARKKGGRFMLRIDDTDAARSEERFVESIRRDLAWLGMVPDGEERQSARQQLYEQAFARLKADGRVYRAYETAQELELKRKIQLGRGRPPIYDRAALELTEADHAARLAEGVQPHWRFRLDHTSPIEWNDAIRGTVRFDPALLSDPVIRRADDSWLYMLPSAVDDIDMAITDVLRGEDHVSNTAVQIQMFEALGATPPAFAHEALLVGSEGKLSKRLGSLGVEELRASGIEPMAVLSLLARLGSSQPVEPVASQQVLIDSFDLAHFGRAPARFDEADLARLNAQILHGAGYAAVQDRLPAGMDEAGWLAIRPNIEKLSDAADWWQIVTGPVASPDFEESDRAYLSEALALLDWSDDPWRDWTGRVKEATGRKGKTLFLPLRLALTGRGSGPDMAQILPLIGEDAARRRLERAATR